MNSTSLGSNFVRRIKRLNENFSISTEMNEQPTTCADRSTEKLKRLALIYERRADRNKWAALRVHPVQGQ
jgi:hypothetical protein